MSLFPKSLGSIVLPPLPERKQKAGSNWIVQHVFQGATTKAQIAPSDIKGHDLVTTGLQPPYRDFLLRHKGARKIETDLPVLTSSEPLNYEDQPETFELRWDSLGRLETYADTPEKVREAWVNQFNFLTEGEDAGRPGLRLPQIAALHAISAHFAVGTDFDAATVVLPTGTGKTETMLATQVYRRLEKTLVLVPSDALRSQISNKFISLGVLPAATVVPQEIACPRVAVIAGGIKTAVDAREILTQSKHIGLPNLYRDLKRRHETWAREGATRFVKGDMKKLSYFKEKARRSKLDFEMILVQPGGSIASITDDALRLLATTELYLYKTTQAKFRAIISP